MGRQAVLLPHLMDILFWTNGSNGVQVLSCGLPSGCWHEVQEPLPTIHLAKRCKTPMTFCLISISGKVSGARTSSHFDLNGQAWSKLCPLLTKSPPKFTIEIMKRTQRHCFPRLVWKNAEQRKMMEHDEANKKRRTGKCAASLVCLWVSSKLTWYDIFLAFTLTIWTTLNNVPRGSCVWVAAMRRRCWLPKFLQMVSVWDSRSGTCPTSHSTPTNSSTFHVVTTFYSVLIHLQTLAAS